MEYDQYSPGIFRANAQNKFFTFLALLCATAQRSYCRPSVRKTRRFLKAHQADQCQIWKKKYLFTISPNQFLNFAFLIFYEFYSFSLTYDHMEEKTSNDISYEST